MQAGKLRHWIKIQKLTTGTKASDGTPVETWTSNVGAWASIFPLQGREYFAAQQLQASATHRVRMRHTTLAASTEISPSYCRVAFGSRIFSIQSVINIEERDKTIDLMCNEEV